MEFNIGKKADVYPSKKTINLYYKEDKSTAISTIVLDVLFVVVVLFGLAKFLVIDVLAERNEALEQLERAEAHLEHQLEAIADYDEVSDEYARYSYKILVGKLNLHDRPTVLKMLEDTMFKSSVVTNVALTEDVVSLSFEGMNLDETAKLIEAIQNYEIVDSVVISNQSGTVPSDTYSGNMLITLKDLEEDTKTGGAQ